MAEEEAHPKRPREEEEPINPSHDDDSKRHKPLHNILNLLENVDDDSKRHKPLHNILNLLENVDDDADYDDVSHDLTAIFATLQQELSPSSSNSLPTVQDSDPTNTLHETASDEDETAKSVIRHLLEASDDELGIPNRRENENCFEGIGIGSGEELGFNFGEEGGLWELEDETANYYTVLQAEFLM